MDYIQGTVKNITFYNEDNAFAILRITVDEASTSNTLFSEAKESETVKGYLPDVRQGEAYRFYGEYEHHEKYGEQFRFNKYEKVETTSKAGLIDYLSSDLFPGIGEKTAFRIVDTLGTDAITKIMNDRDVLDGIKGLAKKHKKTLYEGLNEHKANEQTLIKLYDYGITPKIAKRLIDVYQDDTLRVIRDNPYRLIEDVEGIGFERADVIARELGIEEDDPRRIRAMIVYLFNFLTVQKGHTHFKRDSFLTLLYERLNKNRNFVSEETLASLLEALIDEGAFVIENDHITTTPFSRAENTIADTLRRFSEKVTPINTKKALDAISDFEAKEDIAYTERQKQAILKGLKHQVMILSGGPGTGKTTVIKGLIHAYTSVTGVTRPRYETETAIHLVAPTGRAAKRMQESSGAYAQTIHRFLGYGYDGLFAHDSDNPKEGRLFIIDEASMIDTLLAERLFSAINPNGKIIIVGDEAQLPSVGSGQVLKDLIDSEALPLIRLKTIHRQAKNSSIIHLANAIRQGGLPDDLHERYEDRYVIRETEANFKQRLKNMLDYFLDKGYDLYDDLQILIPMYKGASGIDEVNQFIQETYNPKADKHLTHGERLFKINDKVLQLQNRAEDGVMNGDQGRVIGIDTENNLLYVDFFGTEVEYKKSDLDQLRLAYAMSIHKSQGSEYRLVIMPLFKRFSIMLKRKLIYTGITRAKETLIMVGEIDLLHGAIKHLEDSRTTMLKEKLSGDQPKTRQAAMDEIIGTYEKEAASQTIDDPEIPFDTLGEEPNGLSPYDFLKEDNH